MVLSPSNVILYNTVNIFNDFANRDCDLRRHVGVEQHLVRGEGLDHGDPGVYISHDLITICDQVIFFF